MDAQQAMMAVQDTLTVRRVFGEPIGVNGVTIIPAAALSGGGGGGGKPDQAGGGFGVRAKPAGIFVVRGDDVRWRPAVDVNRVVLGGQIVMLTAILVLGPVLRRVIARRRLHRGRELPAYIHER